MSEFTPGLIDPFRMVDRCGLVKSKLYISEFGRLREYLADDAGVAEFELSFRKQDKIAAIRGHVQADLVLGCQVCMEKLIWSVHNKINLAVVSSIEEANWLPNSYEPLVLEEKLIAIKDIIEDELLLALPSIPRHQNCRLRTMPIQENSRENQFSILTQLKNREGH